MSWLVPRPASLKDTVSDPLLFRLPLALMKCSLSYGRKLWMSLSHENAAYLPPDL
jgi:hypothetical protein